MAHHVEFTRGLHELGDGCHAFLQPDGGWGWSNAGLISGDGASLLVDTLFDLRLTAEMLDAMGPLTSQAPPASLVNTHANGDHCYGNSEAAARFDGLEIISSTAAADEMTEVPPAMLAALNSAPGEVGELFRSFFGEFQFDGIDLTLPDHTFDGRLTIEVGGRAVELIEVGPAHTRGDVLVHVPDDGVVFTGDIHQIDTPYLDSQSNGLTVLIDRMKDQELFAHVNLQKGERSPLAELASRLL